MKIILLLDSLQVSAWVWEAVAQVHQENNVEIVLAVINEKPKASGKKSPFLYRAYRGLDRKFFLKYPDAFAQKDLTKIPGWKTPELRVSPMQKKYSDYFQEEDIGRIKYLQPDVILRFGFRILRGEILNLPKYGVWSYHHGDNRVNRGGPPCFWEVMNQAETTGSILQILTEDLDDGQVLYRSWIHTDPLSVQRNANKAFWTSSHFIARVLRDLATLGESKWRKKVIESQDSKGSMEPAFYRPPENAKMLKHWIGLWARNFKRLVSEKFKKPHWEIFIVQRSVSVNSVNTAELKPYLERKAKRLRISEKLEDGRYFADPFILEREGTTYLFFEDFDPKSKKGKISMGIWDGVSLDKFHPILEENWHLSYPFLWEENGKDYLIPESGEAGKLYLYEAKDFPYKWEKIGIWFDGEAYDPTIYFYKNKYWLFVNQKATPASSPFVELYLYSSGSFLDPVWVPHPLNPIVSDVKSSRPAGRVFESEGKLIRPAQDSGKLYGHKIRLQQILKLNEKEYEEVTIDEIGPEFNAESMGTHTLNFSDNWMVLDGYSRK